MAMPMFRIDDEVDPRNLQAYKAIRDELQQQQKNAQTAWTQTSVVAAMGTGLSGGYYPPTGVANGAIGGISPAPTPAPREKIKQPKSIRSIIRNINGLLARIAEMKGQKYEPGT